MIRRHISIALLWAAAGSWVVAQEPAPPQEPPANESLEPAVDTSAAVDADQKAEPNTPDVPPATPAAPATPAMPPARARTGKALDRLELDTTQITGNRELPKVLYIVPWKRSDLGDLLGRPVGSLLDEVLAPVDRDVFKRETRYYRALQPDAAAAAPTSTPAAEPGRPE